MQIETLSIEGFRSFKNKQIIEFDENGLFLVSGSNLVEPELGANGVGKSSIFEAIVWVLFGKTASNLKAGSIGNWSSKKCKVELKFDNHILKRTWNPNSLILDNEEITQEKLEDIINFNFQSFIYSVYIPQFGIKFIDLTPSEKMEVFSSIMDELFSKWDKCSESAKTLRDDTEKNITSQENKKSYIEGQIKTLKPFTKEYDEWEEERKNLIRDMENEISSYDKNKLISSLKELENKYNDDVANIDKLRKTRNELRDDKLYLTDTLNSEKLELKEMITNDKIIGESINELSILKDGSECPTCDNIISKEKISNKINRLSFKLHTDEITNKEEHIEELVSAIGVKSKDITELENSYALLEGDVIRQLRLIDNTKNEISLIDSKILGLIDTINKKREKENPFKKLIDESVNKKNILEKSLDYLKENIEELKEIYEIYKYWVKGFKEIKLMLTEEALIDLEISINNNLQRLGLNDWSIKLMVDSETKSGTIRKGFTVLVNSPFNNGELVPFECWSGGEGQRIRIATTLGLSDFIKSRRGIECDLLVLDEPTQFLSGNGIEDLVYFLREKADYENLKVFLIDHRNLETLGVFTKVLNITKGKDGSMINV